MQTHFPGVSSFNSNRPSDRSRGNAIAIAATTTSVPIPPLTTDTTGPKNFATSPLSNAPISLLLSMKTSLSMR